MGNEEFKLANADSRRWYPSVPGGILVQSGVWNAGRVLDILALDEQGNVLAATDTGGVWRISPANGEVPFQASNVSRDWNYPSVRCLARGPLSAHHVYAGCAGGLYESSPSDPLQFTWQPVPLPVAGATVRSIATCSVQGYPTRVVIALQATTGQPTVWWADEAPAEQIVWVPAKVGYYEGLPQPEWGSQFARAANSVHVTGDGVLVGLIAPDAPARAVWHGGWETTELELTPTSTTSTSTTLTWVTVAVSGLQGWALSVDGTPGDAEVVGGLGELWRSDDGGRQWDVAARFNTTDLDGSAASGSREQRRVTVSPVNPDVIGVGGKRAQISTNGGADFAELGPGVVHDDNYVVYFDPHHALEGRIMIATDGGVFTADGYGLNGPWDTQYNSRLGGSLQFLTRGPSRGFWGSMGQSPTEPPLVGGGLQDNGNVYADLTYPDPYWKKTPETADGGAFQFLDDGSAVGTVFGGSPSVPSHWPTTPQLGVLGAGVAIPVVDAAKPKVETGDIKGMCELVLSPSAPGPWGTPILGHGWVPFGNDLFALARRTGDDAVIAGKLAWYRLATIPSAVQGLWSTGSLAGDVVFAGTADGRIFSIKTDGTVRAHNITLNAGRALGAVSQIVPSLHAGTWAILESGAVVTLDGNGDFVDRTPAGNTMYYSVAVHDHPHHAEVFVAATDTVFCGPPTAGTPFTPWRRLREGLPRVPAPSNLLAGRAHGVPTLFLTTYGWGLWELKI